MIITSNLVFSEWDRIFKDPMTTAATIDRLVHHSVILEMTGRSVRADAAEQAKKERMTATTTTTTTTTDTQGESLRLTRPHQEPTMRVRSLPAEAPSDVTRHPSPVTRHPFVIQGQCWSLLGACMLLGVGSWGCQDAQAPDPASRSAAVEPAPPTVDEELIFLGRLPGAFSHGGYNGFDWLGDTDFKNTYNSSVGYPSCQGPSCDYGVPYADLTCANRHPDLLGGSTSNSWPWSAGDHPMHNSACDVAPGHSGGALIARSDGNILGTEVFSSCSGTNCAYSTLGPRINGPVFAGYCPFVEGDG